MISNQKGKVIVESNDAVIVVLSNHGQLQWQGLLRNIQSAEIIAMITRYKTDSEEQYQFRC